MKMGRGIIYTFHDNKYTAVIESVFVFSLLCVKTEGPIVKRLDVSDLQ